MVANTELSQLVGMRLMGLMMVVVTVVISRRSFIQGFSTVAAPLTSMLRTTHQWTHQLVRPGLRSSMMRLMLVANWSKSCQEVEKSSKSPKSLKGLKKLQRPLVRRNVYQSTNSPSIKYKELKLSLKVWQFFVLFCWARKLSQGCYCSNYRQSTANRAADALLIIDKAKLMELLMLCHVFSSKELVFFKLLCTKHLSAQHTSSFYYLSSGMYSEYFDIKTTWELVAQQRFFSVQIL